MPHVAVVGAGSWGTALAIVLARRGIPCTLWARRANLAELITATRCNASYLPGVLVPDLVSVTASLPEARADVMLVVTPASAVVDISSQIPLGPLMVSCAKGLDPTGARLSVGLERLGHRVAVLSGPNHAEEIALGLPAASVIAATHAEDAREAQALLSGPAFRVYSSDDVTGVELGGVLKNVIALAAGMADGLSLGDNAKAALVTRGLREMSRLAEHEGARRDTLYGLSGLGDLLATCYSVHSRNRAAGERIARYLPPGLSGEVVEGLASAPLIGAMARQLGLDLPLVEAVNAVLAATVAPRRALESLMNRPPGSESQT